MYILLFRQEREIISVIFSYNTESVILYAFNAFISRMIPPPRGKTKIWILIIYFGCQTLFGWIDYNTQAIFFILFCRLDSQIISIPWISCNLYKIDFFSLHVDRLMTNTYIIDNYKSQYSFLYLKPRAKSPISR